mgnify:CR=1 FL=1
MNPRIDLDFTSRGPRRWHQWIMLVAGLASLAAAVWTGRERAGVLADAESALGRLTRRAERVVPPPEPPLPTARLKATERELLRPWQAMLQALEAAHHPKIQMLSIEPDGRSGLVTVTGQATGFKELTEYLEHLRASVLRDVLLQSHQRMADLPARPVLFAIVARWDAPLAASMAIPGVAR